MLVNFSYHIWFKVCRPFRHTYKLSTNCLLVLNGIYCYSLVNNKPFTRNQMLNFVGYYNNRSIQIYLSVLIGKGFIKDNGLYKGHLVYSLSSSGLSVIQELNDSYNIELRKFIDLYNIVL